MLHDDFENEVYDGNVEFDVAELDAICCRGDRHGGVEGLLVGSHRTASWGVRKGHRDAKKSSSAAVLKEAFEDAGLTAVVGTVIFGSSSYQKDNRLTVAVHSVPVNSFLKKRIRKTRWSPPKETLRDACQPGLRSLLPRLETTSL